MKRIWLDTDGLDDGIDVVEVMRRMVVKKIFENYMVMVLI